MREKITPKLSFRSKKKVVEKIKAKGNYARIVCDYIQTQQKKKTLHCNLQIKNARKN
jgi:hypothetical protein